MAEQNHVYGTYAPPPTEFVRGEGAHLFDAEGNRFLDCTSGIAVNALGHSHPHLIEALKTAADGVWHLSNVFAIPGQRKLAERLCKNTFADRVFFTNSGAEALECAIKTARHYHYDNGQPDRYEIITFEGAFHGRTIATIAAGGQEKYLEGFGPKAPGFTQVPFDDVKALKAAVNENTAAILFEPVQGEGGVREFSGQMISAISELCQEHGILMVLDEVQTGVGRTGKLFAYQWHNLQPDIMAIAKGIGGGFPLGACLAREEVAKGMVPGTHGSTFGGNPLAMAVGNAVLDVVLKEGFLEEVEGKAIHFRQMLAEIVDTFPDLLDGICGSGLLTGFGAKVPNTDIIAAFRDQGLLVLGAGNNVVRILPPLVITDEDLAEAKEKMIAGLTIVKAALEG